MNEFLQQLLFLAAGTVDQWKYSAIGGLLCVLGCVLYFMYLWWSGE